MRNPEICQDPQTICKPRKKKKRIGIGRNINNFSKNLGAEANHGHYIAHIQETTNGQWFKFSDAHVEKLQGRNTRLGSEVDPMSNGSAHPNAGPVNGQINGAKRMVNGVAKFAKVYNYLDLMVKVA